jgi:pre-mRNA-processing factor 19
MEVDGGAAAAAAAGITDAVLAALTAKAQELTKTRKKRPVPPTQATQADVAAYVEKASVAPHATKSPGVLCVDLHPTLPLTVSGGADKDAVVFDHGKGQVAATLAGHTKKVTACVFHRSKPGVVLTASADKTMRLWSAADGAAKATVDGFGAEVTGLSVHPTGDYAAVSGKDGAWSFASLTYATVLEKVWSSHLFWGKG